MSYIYIERERERESEIDICLRHIGCPVRFGRFLFRRFTVLALRLLYVYSNYHSHTLYNSLSLSLSIYIYIYIYIYNVYIYIYICRFSQHPALRIMFSVSRAALSETRSVHCGSYYLPSHWGLGREL